MTNIDCNCKYKVTFTKANFVRKIVFLKVCCQAFTEPSKPYLFLTKEDKYRLQNVHQVKFTKKCFKAVMENFS